MSLLDQQLKMYRKNHKDCEYDQEKLQETIKCSKIAFEERETPQMLTYMEFIYEQSHYIHKRWWILQGVLLLFLWFVLKYTDSSYYTQRCMGIIAPLFVILVMPEMYKNRISNALEIESTTYFSIRQVYAARMILFGLVDFLLVSCFFFTVSYSCRMTLAEFVIQFLIPMNVTCCICFRTLYSKKPYSETMGLLFCIFWIAVWAEFILNEAVYCKITGPVWIMLMSASILYFIYCVIRVQKECEKMWEVKLWS